MKKGVAANFLALSIIQGKQICSLFKARLMKNYLEDIKKYDAKPDEEAVKRLLQRLSLVLQKRDAAVVSTTDKDELERVEKSWAQEKLGADSARSKEAVKVVADKMKADRMKNRVTFYYLVAKELNALDKI